MPRRIDYYDDPSAPKANSLVPSVNVVVTNDNGEILLIRRSDNGNWAIPGGAIDLGESMTEAAIRETREETGITCEITGLVGIYTDPKHVILYTSNGEVRQEFSIVLTASAVSGTLTPSSESSDVRWIPRDELPSLRMDRSMAIRIEHYLTGRHSPHLGLLAEHMRILQHSDGGDRSAPWRGSIGAPGAPSPCRPGSVGDAMAMPIIVPAPLAGVRHPPTGQDNRAYTDLYG